MAVFYKYEYTNKTKNIHPDANFHSYFMADSSGEWRRRGLDIVQKVPPVQRSAHSAGEQV